MAYRFVLLATVFALPLLAGCEAPGPKVYAVKGKLTINGAPAKDVQIHLYPTDNFGTLGSGLVGPDGAYEILSGNLGRPGVAAGKYKVVLQQMGPSGKEAAMARYGAGSAGGPPPVPKATFPTEYSAADTSPKEVEVKPQSNTIDIDIKS
jgi:hypothetical protein